MATPSFTLSYRLSVYQCRNALHYTSLVDNKDMPSQHMGSSRLCIHSLLGQSLHFGDNCIIKQPVLNNPRAFGRRASCREGVQAYDTFHSHNRNIRVPPPRALSRLRQVV